MKHLFYTHIVSWLLHHANKLPNHLTSIEKELFYTIKRKILLQYGDLVRIDYQYFKDLECHSCDKGIYFIHNSGYAAYCHNCLGTGIYKPKKWVNLIVQRLGKYEFHIPNEEQSTKPITVKNYIEIQGFIRHKKTKYTHFAFFIFMLIFHKNYLKLYYAGCVGYRCDWLNPQNYLHNICHVLKKKNNSIPILNLKAKIPFFQQKKSNICIAVDDDLPF